MDRKTIIIVIALAVVVLFYWQILEFFGLYKPAPAQQPPAQPADTTQVQPQAESASRPAVDTLSEPEVMEQFTAPVSDTLPADTIAIETRKYSILMSSRGGGPVSILLKEHTYRNGDPIQMIPGEEAAAPVADFKHGGLITSKMTFSSSLAPGSYDVTSEPLELEYRYTPADGSQIIRRFIFYPDAYNFDLVVEVDGRNELGIERNYDLIWNSPLGVTEPDPETDYQAMKAVAMMGGSREELDDFKDNQLNQSLPGNTTWAGIRNKYFAAVMIPRSQEADAVFSQGKKWKVTVGDDEYEKKEVIVGMEMPIETAAPVRDSFTVFVGPLSYRLMDNYGVDLEAMLGIGTTPVVGWIIKPFALAVIWLLPLLYKIIPNYGLVIILFALLVKIITMPLSMKSFKSMQAMKEIQPKIEELKEKLKKNPQQMNQEMMKLYKKHGVNPLSGCLPMLPQLPVFFALFSVFRATILLRDAPFVWFINDLSRGATGLTDPYIILTLIMVGSQFLSQYLTMPSTQQNKSLMYIMPLFMGFILYRYPAGLLLYWTCFSLFSLLDWAVFKREKKNSQVKTA